MPAYRLLCTRRNRDGSYDVPSVDMPLDAPDDTVAIGMARRFPRAAFGDVEVAWLIDGARRVVWSNVSPLPRAA